MTRSSPRCKRRQTSCYRHHPWDPRDVAASSNPIPVTDPVRAAISCAIDYKLVYNTIVDLAAVSSPSPQRLAAKYTASNRGLSEREVLNGLLKWAWAVHTLEPDAVCQEF
eukprot:6176080-Amphidinium_carterae.5